MSLNSTPAAERTHIGIFGRRNAGKSSIINAITGQDLAIVADIAGTTTDPVYKTMELLPIGPVVIIDTPGIDDVGELGALRVKKSYQILNKTDIALLVTDGPELSAEDQKILARIRDKEIPYVIAHNKCDLSDADGAVTENSENEIFVSALTGWNIRELKEMIAAQAGTEEKEKRLIGAHLKPSDVVVLVTPIDSSAPKGRLILPQVQTIRDILDSNAITVVTKETELADTLAALKDKPRMVVTDSQVFRTVAEIVPEDIPLTSFSILMAKYKGILDYAAVCAYCVDDIKDGDKVLISEGCTHHRQCEDIGSVKIPALIKKKTGSSPEYVFSSATEFPDDLTPFKMVIHCGGCMLNDREMLYRLRCAREQGVPMTNYGITIAYISGILDRSVQIFPEIAAQIGAGRL